MKANAVRFVIIAVFLGLLSGCAILPKQPSVADPRSVHVWPVATCPSASTQAKPAIFPAVVAGLATPLLTDLVSGVVGIPATAIQNAATADTAGFKATGQNPRYYFSNVIVDAADASKNQFTPPGCYVVAYTKSEAEAAAGSAKSWCDNADFKKSVPSACTDAGKARLDTFGTRHDPEGLPPAVPDFYAEIELFPSGYELSGVMVVRPRVIALHYPESLVERYSKKPRLVTISLNLASPESPDKDPIKPASLGIVLQGVIPGVPVSEESLSSQQSSWIAMPANGSALGAAQKPMGGPYFPFNISATLTEVGDPNLFLQAFAKAVASSAADYTKAIVNAIPPVPTVATQQQSMSAEANLQSAKAVVASDEAKYLSACSPAPTTAAAKASAKAAYETVLADRMKANAAALSVPGSSGSSVPFSPVDQGLTKCFE